MFRTAKRKILAFFGWIERPAAWGLLVGAIITFIGVLIGWITVGEFRWPTLLIAAELIVSGFSSVQEAHDDDPRTESGKP